MKTDPIADVSEQIDQIPESFVPQQVRRTMASVDSFELYDSGVLPTMVNYVTYVPAPPCVECSQFKACCKAEIACKAFEFYVNDTSKTDTKRNLKWRTPKQKHLIPIKTIFTRIFDKERDSAL